MLPGGQCRLDRFGFGCLSTVKNPIVHPLPVFGPKGPPPVKRGVGRPKKPHEPQSDAVVEALAIHKKKKQEKAAAQEVAARLKSDKTRYIAMKLTVIDRVTKLPWGDVSRAHPFVEPYVKVNFQILVPYLTPYITWTQEHKRKALLMYELKDHSPKLAARVV